VIADLVFAWAAMLVCAVADDRPNILIITADNLGYGDLSSFNPESKILTPHLDRLAREGATLTDFYTASPTCTVSRACLLTGRVPERHGLTD
jgi:arylsulfatase A